MGFLGWYCNSTLHCMLFMQPSQYERQHLARKHRCKCRIPTEFNQIWPNLLPVLFGVLSNSPLFITVTFAYCALPFLQCTLPDMLMGIAWERCKQKLLSRPHPVISVVSPLMHPIFIYSLPPAIWTEVFLGFPCFEANAKIGFQVLNCIGLLRDSSAAIPISVSQ